MTSAGQTRPRLRVLQCITRLGLGGAERVAFAIMRELRAEIDFGVFTVYTRADDAVGEEMRRELIATATPWFAGTRLPLKRGGMLTGGIALAQAVRAFAPDVIHLHSETPEACAAVMTCLDGTARRVPIVRTIHNSIFWRYWPRIGRWCDRRLARAAIACVSRAAETEFARYRRDSGAQPPATAEALIYNGVVARIREPNSAPRRPHVRRVLFAGRLEPQKGIDVLCAALPRVRLPQNVRGELVVVGHGAQQPLVEALSRTPPVHWSVTLRPPVASLDDVFNDCDLLVMPSRFEGLGLVAIEASLAGLPVVATAAPGLSEALPADHPWWAPPGDADALAATLSEALAETARWRDVTTTAQRFAQTRFSAHAMAAGYRALYERALELRGGTNRRPA